MELTSLARQVWPNIQWEIDDVDAPVLKRILMVFEGLTREYPFVVPSVKYIGTAWDDDKNKFAKVRDGHPDTVVNNMVFLNPRYYGDGKEFTKSMQESVAHGFHPKKTGSIEASFAHEFGHILLFFLRNEQSSLFPYAKRDGLGIIRDTVSLWSHYHKATDDLSIYATTNDDEAWAEGFVALCFGSPLTEYTISQRKLLDALKRPWYKQWSYVERITDMEVYTEWQNKLSQFRREIIEEA